MDARSPSELLNRLVETYWSTAARHAWRQYQNRGRGAIVFKVETSSNGGKRTPLRYLTFTDAKEAQNSTFALLHELVASYDPEREVVIAAVLPDERTVFDVYERDPPPPKAAN